LGLVEFDLEDDKFGRRAKFSARSGWGRAFALPQLFIFTKSGFGLIFV
jgi:hypothetical protein